MGYTCQLVVLEKRSPTYPFIPRPTLWGKKDMKPTAQYEILVIEDNPTQRAALERILTEAGYNVKLTDSAEKALRFVEAGIDCVIAGVISGDISRINLIAHWKTYFPETSLPQIHETQSAASLVESITLGEKHGVHTLGDAKLLLSKLTALVQACQQDAKAKAVKEVDGSKDGMIGRSPAMLEVFDLIARSSHAFSTVLILGESGTGKDLAAQAIHRNSPRSAGPFIAMNCAAMPESLVESELFGYEKGAFTGATGTRIGRFEAASGGTLFIDEIGDCALPLQAKLLRILENRVVTPLGGHREIKVDTRVVVATSRDLPAMVVNGQFREDLYYRLNIITIRMPPLRERVDDIPLLVRAFIERVNIQNQCMIDSIDSAALAVLQRYRWPGNVRELLNVLERAMVLSDKSKTTLFVSDFPPGIVEPPGGSTATDPANALNAAAPLSGKTGVPLTLAQLEQQVIDAAMVRFSNNRTKAAHAIGISVRTLQRKLAQREAPSVVLLRAEFD